MEAPALVESIQEDRATDDGDESRVSLTRIIGYEGGRVTCLCVFASVLSVYRV